MTMTMKGLPSVVVLFSTSVIAVLIAAVVVIVLVQQEVVVDGFTMNSISTSSSSYSSSYSSSQQLINPAIRTLLLFSTTTETETTAVVETATETTETEASSNSNSIMSTVILNDDIRQELISQSSSSSNNSNEEENAKVYDNAYSANNGILLQPNQVMDKTRCDNVIEHKHYDTYSFDDLFPNTNISNKFNSCSEFRNALRDAIRHDMIFDVNADDINNGNNNDSDTTPIASNIQNIQPPIYSYMSNERRYDELSKNKPLIGYWKKQQSDKKSNDETETETTATTTTTTIIRCIEITKVLKQYLGENDNVPNGDEFMNAIGSLCNSTCTSTSLDSENDNVSHDNVSHDNDSHDNAEPYHWTDVVGVAATQNNKMGDKTKHAWHQDYGHLQLQLQLQSSNSATNTNTNMNIDTTTTTKQSNNYLNNKHVFLGFPYENNYYGTGVLPHIIKLKYEQWSTTEKSIFYTATLNMNTTSTSNGSGSGSDGDSKDSSVDAVDADAVDADGASIEEQLQLQLEEFIIRPKYIPGEIEIIIFRDIDVLHSSPDIQYRNSIMRFG